MRVRISFDALRLCLLVAAGVTSGYLWRAAFESSSPLEAQVAAPPAIVKKTPAPRVVRIVPHHLTAPKATVVARRAVGQPVVRVEQHSSGTLITSHVPSSQPSPTPPASTPPPSTPTPTPPKPSPAPPATAPPPTQTTTPTTVASPPVAAAPSPASSPPSQQPSSQPNLGESQDDNRPGWGKGDDNHDHTGPGGKGK